MNIAELPDESDTSDEDYFPEGKQEEVVSEVDSDGEPEDALSDKEDLGTRGQKRKKKLTKTKKKAKNDNQQSSTCGYANDKCEEPEVDKKKIEEDIWADFMKDTGFKSKNSKSETVDPKPKLSETKTTETKHITPRKEPEKVKVIQVFEFAGEEVKLEKEVAANSAEARLFASASEAPKTSRGRGRGGLSGIGSVLSQLGKKQKITTLEKSKLDWDNFKKEERLEEELSTYNKGKDGYLERQDFLQRADLRRFEIEREVRTIERNKRLNNTL